MANYPFKINLETHDGNQISFFTSSFATDAESLVSASVMVDKINSLKLADEYIQSIESTTVDGSVLYGGDGEDGIKFLSASFTEPNTGSIVFQDTETLSEGGLNFYTFHGTKVCSVLGLPEGIPIYTENFKLSDSSTDTTNYISGEFVSDRVALKRGLKMSPQARVQSNLIWDEAFGEGLLQWVSGSNVRMSMGYDNVNDRYEVSAPIVDSSLTKTSTISGSNGSKQRINFHSEDIEFYENNVEVLTLRDSAVRVNFNGPTGTDVDFKVFSSNGTELIHADAGNHALELRGIGDLDVGGTYTNDTQPAFLALNSGTDGNLAIDTFVKIEFNSVVYDQASNYNNTTDTFTAPVTGKYLLTTQIRLDQIDTAADWVSIQIVTSNRKYRRFIDPNFTADLNQFALNMTTIADMDASDTAHVEFKQSGGTAQVDVNSGNPSSSPPELDTFFSGYLLG